MTLSAGLGAALGSVMALAHVGWLLPRLPPRAGLAVSAALAAAGVLAALWLPSAWWLVPLCVLAGGHLARWTDGSRASTETAGAAPVDASPGDAASRPGDERPASPPTRAAAGGPPAQLGRYKVEGLLGRGAMGAVYVGRDAASGDEVALKTMALSQEFDGEALDEARRRFFREAETAGRLRHPDIVAIHGAGEDAGLAWIAMERLRGHDLSSHTLPDRLLPPEEAVAIAARVAEALAYAHTHGVVHRDVKPANVMIHGDTGQVKVTDFGIARVTDASRTRTGVVLGTPSYMSPEQLSGARVDGRSDLYSCGVMLFQLLTGRLPHQAPTMARMLYAIANEPAPDLRTLRPELPAALADALALALQKRPEMRCADAGAWAADLRVIAGMPPAPPSAGVSPATAPPSGAGPQRAVPEFPAADPMQNSRL